MKKNPHGRILKKKKIKKKKTKKQHLSTVPKSYSFIFYCPRGLYISF